MSETTMKHYTPGQRVLALDPISHVWRPAVVEKDAPYHKVGCGGAYVLWSDVKRVADDPGYMPSSGGWQGENTIKEVED
jgi:hypothetical protein